MCRIVMALCAVVACRAPSAPPSNRAAVTSVPRPGACPTPNLLLAPWVHEVYRGCDAWPFEEHAFATCLIDCPRPCRRRVEGAPIGPQEYAIEYDRDGRWVATRGIGQAIPALQRCSYNGRGIAGCERIDAADRAGSAVRLERDRAGRVVLATDGAMTEIRFTYDGRGNPISEDAGDSTVRYSYDAANRPVLAVEERDAREHTTTFEYDDQGRLRVRSGEDESRYAYDPSGRLVSITRNDGFTVTLSYDSAGRLVDEIARSGDSVDWRVSYAYTCE